MKYVKRYCDKILGEEIRSCEEQKQLCRLVLRAFEEEDIHIDELSVEYEDVYIHKGLLRRTPGKTGTGRRSGNRGNLKQG